MQRLTNLTNSPHPIPLAGGGESFLPAFGTLDGEFDAEHVALLVLVGAASAEAIADKPTKRKGKSHDEQSSASEQ